MLIETLLFSHHFLPHHQASPESLLRSALQGKGYVKTVHLQNGITVIPAQNSAKDEELRRVLFTNDQVRDSRLFTFLCFITFQIRLIADEFN
jgi:hypothetical protein